MASTVYSVRFLQVHAPDGWHVYTVPAGFRAVVRSITCVVYGTGTPVYQVYVATTYILNVSVPANDTRVFDMRQVVYAGEALGASVTLATAHLSVTGYLFADPAGGKAPAVEIYPKSELLPAAA